MIFCGIVQGQTQVPSEKIKKPKGYFTFGFFCPNKIFFGYIIIGVIFWLGGTGMSSLTGMRLFFVYVYYW